MTEWADFSCLACCCFLSLGISYHWCIKCHWRLMIQHARLLWLAKQGNIFVLNILCVAKDEGTGQNNDPVTCKSTHTFSSHRPPFKGGSCSV